MPHGIFLYITDHYQVQVVPYWMHYMVTLGYFWSPGAAGRAEGSGGVLCGEGPEEGRGHDG